MPEPINLNLFKLINVYKRMLQGLSRETSQSQIAIPEFLTAEKALLKHQRTLTELEKREITKYSEIYYISNSKKKHNGKYCDERGYYLSFVGDHIAYRYEILHILGEGSFGIVVSCFDHKLQQPVAIKILRKGKIFEENGELEVKNLNQVRSSGQSDAIIEKFEDFTFRSHFCIVFELLNIDLFNFLKKNNFNGISMNVLRRITIQLLIGLKHIHQNNLIHCDLKPENIMFKLTNKSSVKIIDFGSACEKSSPIFTYIQSRYYRAPEVILELQYTEKIDIWSLGCILFELYTGMPLFIGENEPDQLCRFVEVVGEFPASMVKDSPRKSELFDSLGRLLEIERQQVLPGSRRLSILLKNADPGFIDFLNSCLQLNPKTRTDAGKALWHPWVKGTRMGKSKSMRSYSKQNFIY